MTPSRLNPISEHVYWLAPDATTDRPVLGAVVGSHATLIVDAGNSPAHAKLLLDGLAEVSPAHHQRYLVLTHWHWDHVFGTAAFEMPIFAYKETQQVMTEMAGLDWSDAALDRRVAEGTEIEFCRDMIKAEWPNRTDLRLKLPDVSFTTGLAFDLGGVTCQVNHVGGDHASDACVVVIPEDKIVFLSDCLYEDLHHGPLSYTTAQLFPLIETVAGYNADYYLWGHDPEPMPKTALIEFTSLLKSIGEQVEWVGDQRDDILEALPSITGQPLAEDHIELVEAFLAGLRKGDINS